MTLLPYFGCAASSWRSIPSGRPYQQSPFSNLRARGILRESDLLARYGGKEFMALFSEGRNTDIEGVAERLRTAFAKQSSRVTPNGDAVTLCVGLARGRRDDSVNTIIERADQALYRAKTTGRNQVVFHPEDDENTNA